MHGRKILVEFQKIADVGTSPGVNGLVGVAYYKKVVMVRAEGFHQLVLDKVYVLELVYHDVFKAFLPFVADGFVGLEDVEHELEQVVVVQAKAFFLLVKIAEENNVFGQGGGQVFLVDFVQSQADQVFVVVGPLKKLLDFYHISGG